MMTTTDKTYLPLVKKSLLYIILSAVSILMVLPFLWMISSSFKDARVIFDFPIQWIPENPVLENYVNVWSKVRWGAAHSSTALPIQPSPP